MKFLTTTQDEFKFYLINASFIITTGRKMMIEHFRGEDKTGFITNEHDYSYDSPKFYR